MIRRIGVVIGAVLLVGCGTDEDPEPGPTPTTARETTDPATPTDPGTATEEDVVSCAELLAAGWEPPAEDAPDLSWDPVTGILHLTFTDEQLVLNIRTDAKCQKLPVVGPMIERALADDAVPEG